MNLSIRHLTTFREVMRSGSISEAARNLGRTQPAVSAMIAGLEEELSFALFLREPGKFSPTPEAEFFLEEAEAVLGRLEQTKITLQGISNREKGRVRIACHPAASGLFMPHVVTKVLKEKPGVDVALMMRSSTVIEDLVASQQFDIGFAETPKARNSISQRDYDLECVCALPEDDPLAQRQVIGPRDLVGRPVATLFGEHAVTVQTVEAFRQARVKLHRRFELQTFLPGLQFVGAGLCVMICDMIAAYGHARFGHGPEGIVFRPFRPKISSKVSILMPAHRPASLITTYLASVLSEEIVEMQRVMQKSI